jgi:hypothetical protein
MGPDWRRSWLRTPNCCTPPSTPPTPGHLPSSLGRLLGLQYRQGDEPLADGDASDADWLVLVDPSGARRLAFQQVERLERTTWPTHDVPMQMHLDFTVSTLNELQRHRERAESLGAQLLLDRTDDSNEPLYVLADPSGHPFCIFVA